MTVSDEPIRRGPSAQPVDHPAALGDLADVFVARNIAVGMTPDGNVVLARPDSLLIEMPRDAGRRRELGSFLRQRKLNPDNGLLPEPDDGEPGVIAVSIDRSEPSLRNSERRLSLGAVAEMSAETRSAGFGADLNYVIIGAQVMHGEPLGAQTSWAGEMAFPANVFTDPVTQQTSLLTTAQPTVPPVAWRSPLNLPNRTAPRVLVLDTGLTTTIDEGSRSTGRRVVRRPEHDHLQQCAVRENWTIDDDPRVVDDEDETFDPPVRPMTSGGKPSRSTLLDFEAGHGTFIAGVVLQTCPDAEIVSAGVLSSFGDGDVAGVLSTLKRMMVEEGPFDLVVMSFGTNFTDDEASVFGTELMRLLGPALGVAAAGNQGTCRPYFPAALPGVIGVGAMAAGGKAWFSNFGGWVDACAPGVDVVSTFFANFTEVLDGTPTRDYKGWARWSGTSFSAPKVAAAIAQEMYLYGGTAKEAWKRLSTHKHFRYPDLGVVFNV